MSQLCLSAFQKSAFVLPLPLFIVRVFAMEGGKSMEIQNGKAKFLNDTFWCSSLYCCASGVAGISPLRWYSSKCMCLRMEGNWSQDIAGELGLCSGITKCCCILQMHEFPPDPLLIACCGKFLVGDPSAAGEPKSAQQAEQVRWQKEAFWLAYCCCKGCGFVRCGDPVCESQSKMCCAIDRCETTEICNEQGFINQQNKCCCFANFSTYDCKMSPGIGLCNFMVMKNIPGSGANARELEETLVPAQQTM